MTALRKWNFRSLLFGAKYLLNKCKCMWWGVACSDTSTIFFLSRIWIITLSPIHFKKNHLTAPQSQKMALQIQHIRQINLNYMLPHVTCILPLFLWPYFVLMLKRFPTARTNDSAISIWFQWLSFPASSVNVHDNQIYKHYLRASCISPRRLLLTSMKLLRHNFWVCTKWNQIKWMINI